MPRELLPTDSLLAELSRALKASDGSAGRAGEIMAALEPVLRAGAPQTKAGATRAVRSPKVAGFADAAAEALVGAFPDRGAALAEQLRMQAALGRIGSWLAENRAEYARGLHAGASEKKLAGLEKTVGRALPISLHALFRWHDGAEGYSLFHHHNLMSVKEVSYTWKVMRDLLPQFEGEGQRNWWKKGWVPFLDNGGGDSLVVDLEGTFTGRAGQVLEFWHADSDRNVEFPDLMTWAEVFADSLEAGAWTYTDGCEVDDEKLDAARRARAKGYPREFDAVED